MSLLALYAAQVTLPSHWAELGQDRSTEYARRRQVVKATKNTREEAKRARGAVIRAAVNGEEFLQINSGLMAWDVYEMVEWVSKVMTLNPGDLISMGAPPGFNKVAVKPGDVMKVTIDGIGAIESTMRK